MVLSSFLLKFSKKNSLVEIQIVEELQIG